MRKKYTIHKKRKYIKKNKIKKSNNKIKYTKKKYKEKTKRKQRGGAEEDINGMDEASLRTFIIELMDQLDEKSVELKKAGEIGDILLAKYEEFEFALEELQLQKDLLEAQRNTLETERDTMKFENKLITDLLGNVTSFQGLEDRLGEAEESYSSQELPVWFYNIQGLLAKYEEFESALEALQLQKDLLEEQRNTLESERDTMKFENKLITDLLGNGTSFQGLEDRLREAEELYSSQELPVWFYNIQGLNATHNDNDIEMLIVELTAERDDCRRQYDELSRSIDTREGDLENEKKLFEEEKERLRLELKSKSDNLDAERTKLSKKIYDDSLVLKSRKTQLSEAEAYIAQLENTQRDLMKKQEGDAENAGKTIRNISGCLGEINQFINNLEGLTHKLRL
jgi:chromosome segregation ATPase